MGDPISTNIHSGKTFPYTPYTRIRDIYVSPVKTHLVFELPLSVYRRGAVSFNDFKTDAYSIQFKKLFLFFLDFIYKLSPMSKKDSDEEEFSKIVILLEYDENLRCHRFHIFSDRELDSFQVIKSQLKSNNKAVKKMKILEPHQKHYTINTIFDYVTKICNIYSKSQRYF